MTHRAALRASLVLGWILTASVTSGCGPDEGVQAGEEGGFLRIDEEQASDATAEAGAVVEHVVEPPASPAEATPSVPAPQVEPEVSVARSSPSADEIPPSAEVQAIELRSREAQAAAAIFAGDGAQAVKLLQPMIQDHLARGLDDRAVLARWSDLLGQAQSLNRWSKEGRWTSATYTVRAGDSLIAVRKRALADHPSALICTGLIARANELRSETAIRPDDVLRVPLDRASVLVDLSAMWVFYRLGDELVAGWEVGVGKDSTATRPGVYTIGLKQENPMWSPVGQEPIAFGDPRNPLGTRWLAWHQNGRGTTLGFHGTNDAAGVGRRISEGCIRMRNEDVEVLFDILPMGAEVDVQP